MTIASNDVQRSMDQVREGDVLDGKYRVEHVLGRGGMGMVLSALHLQLGQRVALKLLLPEVCMNHDAVERFVREARAAVQIHSEHVARVSDVGTLASGAPYMVMEFLRGSDLSEVVRTRGSLGVAEAVDYILQACEAIAEAHELGIVHRDLKLANLFLTQRPDRSAFVKVLDFGISKVMGSNSLAGAGSATASAVIMGSPQYMSPEQTMSSKDVDVRTDIWSLGIILHEMLSGAPVFQAESPTAILIMISTAAPTPIRVLRPDVPADLERVILKCLQKRRDDRYPNIASLARALRPFAPEHARVSVDRIARIQSQPVDLPPEPSLPASAGTKVDTGGAWGATQATRRRSRAGVFAIVAVLACVLAGVGVLAGAVLANRGGNGPPTSVAGSETVLAPTAMPTIEPAPIPKSPPARTAPEPIASSPPAEPPRPVETATPKAPEPQAAAPRPAPIKARPPVAPTKRTDRPKDLFDDPK